MIHPSTELPSPVSMGRMGILQRVVRRRIQDALQNVLRRRRLRKRGAVRIAIVQLAGLPAVVGLGRVERVQHHVRTGSQDSRQDVHQRRSGNGRVRRSIVRRRRVLWKRELFWYTCHKKIITYCFYLVS